MAVTHLWVAATARGGDRIFQNVAGKVTKKLRSLFGKVFQKVDRPAEAKATWTDRVEVSWQTGRSPFLIDVTNLSREAFTKIFPQRSMTTLSSAYRMAAARKLISSGRFGKHKQIQALAFVGLCFAMQQETSLSTNEEFVCTEIRNIFQKFHTVDLNVTDLKSDLCVKDFQFGNFIAKGSCSAVYEAKFASTDDHQSEESVNDVFFSSEEDDNFSLSSSHTEFQLQSEMEVQSTSVFSLLDDSNAPIESLTDDDIMVISESESDTDSCSLSNGASLDKLSVQLAAAMLDDILAENNLVDDGVQEERSLDESELGQCKDGGMNCDNDSQFDLAVKMMFNYCAESNAEAVTMAMEKEMVPLKLAYPCTDAEKWKFWRPKKKKKFLSRHPNIVDMKAAFVDQVADFPENRTHYPAALPQRLHPEGLGRNMTMFLVMKRYSSTLRDFVRSRTLDVYTSSLLICQLLEGVTFLQEAGVTHRDLKSDNILVDLENENAPWLVISDFGCCLHDDVGLEIPYNTGEITKGGNRALLAPEITATQPGVFSVLDYRKSDLWTVGSLIYEVFGDENPFYTFDSATYKDSSLPPLPEQCPWLIRKLASNLLQRDPSKRLEPAVAANVVHLFLWRPSWFLKPSSEDVQEWLLAFSRESAYQDMSQFITRSRPTTEHKLQQIFLLRLHFDELINAVNFIFD